MATTDRSSIVVLGDSVSDDSQSQALKQVVSESTSLLHNERDKQSKTCCSCLKSKFQKAVFLKSKSAVLILIWCCFTGVLQGVNFNPYHIIVFLFSFIEYNIIIVVGGVYIFVAILQLFYPLAGLLAGVRYGRYKCVICSLWSFIGGTILTGVGFVLTLSHFYLPYDSQPWSYAVLAVILVFIGVPVVIGIFLFICSIVTFNANVIQFGLDQLHDSPTEYLVLYIHWYVLVSQFAAAVVDMPYALITSSCYLYLPSVILMWSAFFFYLLSPIDICLCWILQTSYLVFG